MRPNQYKVNTQEVFQIDNIVKPKGGISLLNFVLLIWSIEGIEGLEPML